MQDYNIDLRDEIRNLINLVDDKNETFACLLSEKNYDSYYITDGLMKGVGFEISKEHKDFKYSFENILLKVDERTNQYHEKKYFIELLSERMCNEDEFLFICMKFLEAGENGENRKMILKNPQDWVDKWKNLLGNKSADERVYPYIGELLVLRHLLQEGKSAVLTSQGSHDIETESENYEVKTTLMRYDSIIEVHSQHQLASLNGNPLYLYFVRLEDSFDGVSIKSLIKDLDSLGYDIENINELTKDLNTILKTKCYKVLEISEYKVGDDFPKIINESFVNNQLPTNIIGIKYTIDLSGLPKKNIESNI